MEPKIYTFHIEKRVEVFGSNLAGRHGKGHASHCKRYYGAVMGQAEGLMGHCYALPTKDDQLNTLPIELIAEGIARLHSVTLEQPGREFFVARIGCGLAGYRDEQIAPLFLAHEWPDNVYLPGVWQPYFRDIRPPQHRIIVAGTRDFCDYSFLRDTLDRQLGSLLEKGRPISIVNGKARGPDSYGAEYAKERGLPIWEFPAPWDWFEKHNGYKKAAGFARNAMMGQFGTGLSAFWDQKSDGTKSMISLANDFGLMTRVNTYDPARLREYSGPSETLDI